MGCVPVRRSYLLSLVITFAIMAPGIAWTAGPTVKMTLLIFYATGEDSVRSDYDDQILRAKTCVLETPTSVIEIVAYTDSNGNTAANKRLSQRRAEAILQILVGSGVPEGRITRVEGLGEIAGSAPFSRRAEILIMDDEKALPEEAAGISAPQQISESSCD